MQFHFLVIADFMIEIGNYGKISIERLLRDLKWKFGLFWCFFLCWLVGFVWLWGFLGFFCLIFVFLEMVQKYVMPVSRSVRISRVYT